MASSPAMATSCCSPPDSRRGSRLARCADGDLVEGLVDAGHDLGARQPEVGRPEGDLLVDGLGHHRELPGGSPNAQDDGSAEPVHGPVAHILAIDEQGTAQLAADDARRQPAQHQAERRQAGFCGTDDPHDAALGQRQRDVLETVCRGARVAVAWRHEASAWGRPARAAPHAALRCAASPPAAASVTTAAASRPAAAARAGPCPRPCPSAPGAGWRCPSATTAACGGRDG